MEKYALGESVLLLKSAMSESVISSMYAPVLSTTCWRVAATSSAAVPVGHHANLTSTLAVLPASETLTFNERLALVVKVAFSLMALYRLLLL